MIREWVQYKKKYYLCNPQMVIQSTRLSFHLLLERLHQGNQKLMLAWYTVYHPLQSYLIYYWCNTEIPNYRLVCYKWSSCMFYDQSLPPLRVISCYWKVSLMTLKHSEIPTCQFLKLRVSKWSSNITQESDSISFFCVVEVILLDVAWIGVLSWTLGFFIRWAALFNSKPNTLADVKNTIWAKDIFMFKSVKKKNRRNELGILVLSKCFRECINQGTFHKAYRSTCICPFSFLDWFSDWQHYKSFIFIFIFFPLV